MIYLACPYSHPDPAVREARYDYVTRVAGHLMTQGKVVFSPLTHSHPVAKRMTLPVSTDWEFWAAQDLPILRRCDLLYILTIPGWEESTGVTAEINYAMDHHIPRVYFSMESIIPLPEILKAQA